MVATALTIRNLFDGPDLLIILAIVLLIFGGSKLPDLARGMGRSIRIFKSEMAEGKDEQPAEPSQIEGKVESTEASTTEAPATPTAHTTEQPK